MFWAKIWKISNFFYLKNCHFLVVKFSVYLNRRVFVIIIKNVKKKLQRITISSQDTEKHPKIQFQSFQIRKSCEVAKQSSLYKFYCTFSALTQLEMFRNEWLCRWKTEQAYISILSSNFNRFKTERLWHCKTR